MQISINDLFKYLDKKYEKKLILSYFNINSEILKKILEKKELKLINLIKIKNKLNLEGCVFKEFEDYYILSQKEQDELNNLFVFIENKLSDNNNKNNINKKYIKILKLNLSKFESIKEMCDKIGIGLSTYNRILYNQNHTISNRIKAKLELL